MIICFSLEVLVHFSVNQNHLMPSVQPSLPSPGNNPSIHPSVSDLEEDKICLSFCLLSTRLPPRTVVSTLKERGIKKSLPFPSSNLSEPLQTSSFPPRSCLLLPFVLLLEPRLLFGVCGGSSQHTSRIVLARLLPARS